MPFNEDFNEFLSVNQGFASLAYISRDDGVSYALRGILTKEVHELDFGDGQIVGGKIIFETAETELIDARHNDKITIDNIEYKIKMIKNDGSGWVVLILEKQG